MCINTRFRGATFVLVVFGLYLVPLCAKANGLVGTSVTGSLFFSGLPSNYYDPANGYVPSGYLNTAGITVTIAAPAVEFGFMDAHNTDLANFSASQFTIEDVLDSTAGGADTPWTMTFDDPAFATMSFAKASDSFPHGGLTLTRIGTTKISLSWAGGPVTANDDYTSTFVVVTPIPEPATWTMLLGGLGVAVAIQRLRRAVRA